MTFATKITVGRICLVPVFALLAILYGLGVRSGEPVEAYRWMALGVFMAAAASDGIDGWIARRFDQISELGAFLDPIADKALVLTAFLILTVLPWGAENWRIPYAFTALVILRECVILCGIRILWSARRRVQIHPHWLGKLSTFMLFFVLGWVMLRITHLPPAYPCAIAAIFLFGSTVEYFRQGVRILKN
jgi:cardiolipin synthase (CMP-forming)